MEREKLLYLIDVLLGISFLSVFVTGLFKWRGVGTYLEEALGLTLNYQQLSTIHDWSGLFLGLLVFIHLALHFRWIVAMTKNIFKRGSKFNK